MPLMESAERGERALSEEFGAGVGDHVSAYVTPPVASRKGV